MILSLDTTDNLNTRLKLGPHSFHQAYASPREQDVLGAILTFLKTKHLTLDQLTGIEVNPGPGSFTGIRVGLALAQALSYTLNLPINGQPPGTFISPRYGKPPSITLSKRA